MSFLCRLFGHEPAHLYNAQAIVPPKTYQDYSYDQKVTYDKPEQRVVVVGIYQCQRCKKITVGASR